MNNSKTLHSLENVFKIIDITQLQQLITLKLGKTLS